MSPLTATDVLRVWELGQRQGSPERALTVLAAACPEMTTEQLIDLNLGERDRKLLTLHQRLFGPELRGCVECPNCRERLEFALGISDMQNTPERIVAQLQEWSFSAFEFDVRFRLPTSRDLLAAAACADTSHARSLLIHRCLTQVRRAGEGVAVADLPETLLTQLAQKMAECDPGQEVLLEMSCPECGHRWQPLLDIVSFLWEELSSQAKQLMREVHALASAYGWSESDILALSARRRRSYLEMVGT